MPPHAKTPDLLFVHGAHVGAWVWEEHFLPFFEARGHRCTALELRDAPDHQQAGRESLADYATRLVAALERAPTPPVVVAHSMGAAVALRELKASSRTSGAGTAGASACPMAVIGGGGDRLFGPALVKTSAAWLNAPCEIVPRMGHLLMLESDWERAAMATARAVATATAVAPEAA